MKSLFIMFFLFDDVFLFNFEFDVDDIFLFDFSLFELEIWLLSSSFFEFDSSMIKSLMTCKYFMHWFAAFKCFESELIKCRINSDEVLIIFDSIIITE